MRTTWPARLLPISVLLLLALVCTQAVEPLAKQARPRDDRDAESPESGEMSPWISHDEDDDTHRRGMTELQNRSISRITGSKKGASTRQVRMCRDRRTAFGSLRAVVEIRDSGSASGARKLFVPLDLSRVQVHALHVSGAWGFCAIFHETYNSNSQPCVSTCQILAKNTPCGSTLQPGSRRGTR
jgi:hypothetical protein